MQSWHPLVKYRLCGLMSRSHKGQAWPWYCTVLVKVPRSQYLMDVSSEQESSAELSRRNLVPYTGPQCPAGLSSPELCCRPLPPPGHHEPSGCEMRRLEAVGILTSWNTHSTVLYRSCQSPWQAACCLGRPPPFSAAASCCRKLRSRWW